MTPKKGINGSLVYENDDVELVSSFVQRGYRTTPIIYINGKKVPDHTLKQSKPNQTLLSFLRDEMHLTGSKLGCGEGGCGACSVMISKYSTIQNKIVHFAVNACLMPVLAADECHVTTIEGVGSCFSTESGKNDDGLHPIQKAMVDMHGSQCGFCTPGIIVAIYSLFANNTTKDYIEEHLDGNLCRCTGYRPIWDAARSLCTDIEQEGEGKGPCGTSCRECPERNTCTMDCNTQDIQNEQEESSSSSKCSSSSILEKFLKPQTTIDWNQNKIDENNNNKWLDQPNEMFPKELIPNQNDDNLPIKPLMVVDRTYHKAGTWFKPTTLNELLSLMKRFSGECKIIVGNTEVGIETKFKHSVYPRFVSPSESIASLYSFSKSDDSLTIGSCVSLSTIQHECSEIVQNHSKDDNEFKKIAEPIHDMLRWFASTQIRNVACLGGNLATASPISDMNPMLACMNATLTLSSLSGNSGENDDDNRNDTIERRNVLVSDFFLAYRTVDLEPYEIVETIIIPKPKALFEYIFPFKQAKRREDDISIVTSGMRIVVAPCGDEFTIVEVSLAFGGMAPRTVMAKSTAEYLVRKPFKKETFTDAKKVLLQEFDLPDDVPGGQAQFRKALACSFLYKLYMMTCKAIGNDLALIEKNPNLTTSIGEVSLPKAPTIDENEESAIESFVHGKKPSIQGKQIYPTPKVAVGLEGKARDSSSMAAQVASKGRKDEVGNPATHASGPLHCTGEALYTDDIPLPPGTLQATLILAKTCNSKYVSIDTSVALNTPGVVAVYTHEDIQKIGGDNIMGPIEHDEFVFLPRGEVIQFVGQVLGVCIADSLDNSEAGARSVVVEYGESLGKPVVSIEDAIEAESFYGFARHTMERSNPMSISSDDKIVKVSGSFRCGGQEHFYLETNSTLAVPSESATNMTVYTSTQAVTKTQMYCASATNLAASRVVVRMKRMGGGFGGKETRSVFASCAAAVAAKISNCPVRLTLSRDVDMSITGGRHAFLAKYEASAVIKDETKEVKLNSLKVELFCNGGSAFDLSGPVMDRALFHVDNCYFWPEFYAEGVPCKTVQPPHTAFRGFGGPQGLATCEHIIDHLALECGVSGYKLRRNNIYKVQEATPFGMILGEEFAGKWNVPTMWDNIHSSLNIDSRQKDIDDFNSNNKWVKRGLSLLPTKFGIAFTAKYMNQGGALVHLYTDGTVLVSHGGTEMGQGLHTKVCQVAAQAFGIPLNDVYVNDTSSDKVANTIPTAASMSTDMYGMATLDACRQILKRIEPIRQNMSPDATLKEVANKAFFERIDLSAHGFFALDNSRCGYDWTLEKPKDFPNDKPQNSWKGHPFNYFTQGVAYTEVEVDVLTGNHRTIRSDLLVDVGCSISPALDIGQIEGAFIQGMGWCTLEEIIYGDDDHTWVKPRGRMFTTGPGTYKIPAFNDVPETFNVSLMDNADNPFAVHSSKAIGEPPFFLGCGVFYAIKDAIKAARSENCTEGYFELRMPATSERIRMACLDDISLDCIATTNAIKEERLSVAKTYQPKGSV